MPRSARKLEWGRQGRRGADPGVRDDVQVGPDFGERQYEFAVNFEITTTLGGLIVGGLPQIPTTNEEAKKGYDALFDLGTGYRYHLQYKVPTYASRKTGKNPLQWAFHNGPYYRFALLADSAGTCRQHLKLEALRKVELGVYYCAPKFHLSGDYWSHAAASSVFANSALIDVANVTLPTPLAPHAVSYDLTGAVKVWSESAEGDRRDRGPGVRRAQPLRDVSADGFRRLLLALADTLASDPSVPEHVPRADALQRTAHQPHRHASAAAGSRPRASGTGLELGAAGP
jgi:hypothetical protein